MKTIGAVILAAGKGTRLKASHDKNKVVYTLNDHPMIWYSLQNIRLTGIENIYVVVGFAKESVISALGPKVTYIDQQEQLGTGHALKVVLPYLDPNVDTLISMYGDDSAFYPPELLHQLIKEHRQRRATITLLTLRVDDPTGLGRIVRVNHQITGIVEEKNATPEQRAITEINTGLYCFDVTYLKYTLPEIKKNPVTQEYYLTDIVSKAYHDGRLIHSVTWPHHDVWYGVNTREQLQEARRRMTKISQ
jgi:bifunctional UDP-N-acetylglucosamine pyrophosphorylase/glucosamine-1-phosphate N-acetyltransferase